jgi:hypothetical protein
MRPNPPKIVTVVLAVLSLLIGLALIYMNPTVADLVKPLGQQVLDWVHDKTVAWIFMAASPLLLILGSLFKGL